MRLRLSMGLLFCLWLTFSTQSQANGGESAKEKPIQVKTEEPSKTQAGTPNWIVKPPPQKIILLYNRETSFAVFSDKAGITNLRVVHSSLQDSTTGAQLGPQWLSLCIQKDSSCTAPVNVGANTAERITLRVDPRFQQNGTFVGSVFIASEQKMEPYALDLAIYSTKRSSQYWGVSLIVIGVALSWVISSYLQQRALRADALRPAAELGDCLAELYVRLEQLEKENGFSFPASRDKLDSIQKQLSPDFLENKGFIPTPIRNAFLPLKDLSNEYKQFLSNISTNLTILDYLLREGVIELQKIFKSGASQAEITSALGDLDQLPTTAKTLEDARAGLTTIRQQLLAALKNRAPQAAPAPPAPIPLPSVAELRVLLRRLSMTLWLIWGGLTVLIGTVALVSTNYGFGVGLDYFKCFFWGLGIQIAGQQLQQLAPSTITTTLNVPLPKTK